MERSKTCSEIISRYSEIISRYSEIISRYSEIISRDWETFSRDWEIISRNWEAVSRDWEIISRDWETLSREWETLSRDRETISRDREAVSRDWETISRRGFSQDKDLELANRIPGLENVARALTGRDLGRPICDVGGANFAAEKIFAVGFDREDDLSMFLVVHITGAAA